MGILQLNTAIHDFVQAERVTDANTHSITITFGLVNTHADADCDRNAHLDPISHDDAHADGDCHVHLDPISHADAYPDGDCHAHVYADGDRNVHLDPISHADARTPTATATPTRARRR